MFGLFVAKDLVNLGYYKEAKEEIYCIQQGV
jgi:hypothetical protein